MGTMLLGLQCGMMVWCCDLMVMKEKEKNKRSRENEERSLNRDIIQLMVDVNVSRMIMSVGNTRFESNPKPV